MRAVEVEQKCVIGTPIQQPIERSFLNTFSENKQNVEWLDRVNEKYGARIQLITYQLLIERIINALNARNRSNEIFLMVDKYLETSAKYSLENIRNIPLKNEEALIKSWPMYLYGTDKQGHPVFYDDVGSLDLAKVITTFSNTANDNYKHELTEQDEERKMLELCLQFRCKFYAKMSFFKQLQSEKYNTTIFKHILVMDLSNFSYLRIATNLSSYAKLARSVLSEEQMLYPETLYKLYLINCPWTFTICWKILSSFIDEKTIAKIKLMGADYLEEMLNDIDITQIPTKYGGKGIWKIKLSSMYGDNDLIDNNDVSECE